MDARDACRRSSRQRLDPEQRYGLRLTLFAVAIILVFVPFGFLLAQVVDEGPLTLYDRRDRRGAARRRSRPPLAGQATRSS